MLQQTAKWTKSPMLSGEVEEAHGALKLSDLFVIKRGIATGANNFFVLTPEQAAQHQIPREFLMPIFPSPRYLQEDEIKADSESEPILERKLYLLACSQPEAEVKTRYPKLWTYLQTGIDAGIDKRYLCQHRTPWYTQEIRLPATFLCTYMGRGDTKKGSPFRFILNHSKAIAANVYLMLYPKPLLEKVLKARPELIRAVWQALNQIPVEALIGEGRVYGGGLYKMEPKELGNIPVEAILSVIPELMVKKEKQMGLFKK
jgi:hypothetical protein